MDILGYLITLLIAMGITYVESNSVLVLHPVYAGSHILSVRRILDELLVKGYKVKVVRWLESSHIKLIQTDRYSETILAVNNSEGKIPFLTKEERAEFQFPSQYLWEEGLNPLAVLRGPMLPVVGACEALFSNEKLIKELKSENFKVAIVDLIYNECGLALVHHLNIPAIGYWGAYFGFGGEIQHTTAFTPPSSIPQFYLPYSDEMTFFQSFINFYYNVGSHLVMYVQFMLTHVSMVQFVRETPYPSTLLANLSGLLINGHPALDYAVQLPPSFFKIGGFHIRDPKPLPKDLEEFITDAVDGVILVSLGKNFNLGEIPSDVFFTYFSVFEKLRQKVIVRTDMKPNALPSNIKVANSIPQADILAHPNTILFVTHCGMHGVMEAIHYGVKMIGIPIFFDQLNIASLIKNRGVGIILSKTSSESEIKAAFSEILFNNTYQKNMDHISKLYHSFGNSLERAIWLIEHVIQFNGGHHLKLSTRNLSFVQYFCLDVIFVSILIIIFIFFVISYSFHFLRKMCFSNVVHKEKRS